MFCITNRANSRVGVVLILLLICYFYSKTIIENIHGIITIKQAKLTHLTGGKISECQKSKPEFLLGFLTSNKSKDLRNALREGWLHDLKLHEDVIPFNVTYKFLADRETPEFTLENKLYNDIVYLNVTSSGYAFKFGEKLHVFIKYALRTYPNITLAARVDDDAFLCVPHIFHRIYSFVSSMLYYGWRHGTEAKISTHNRVDEMFLVMGSKLMKRIAKRKYCRDIKLCDPSKDLIETNWGDVSFANWIGNYTEVDFIADNKLIVHGGRGASEMANNYKKYVKLGFCQKFLIYHKALPKVMRELSALNKRPYKENETIFR